MGVDAELWRIFTFYSLHYDANQPDIWKITPFVRFAKDCQITGPKFMVSELELEIVRLARSKRKIMRGTTALRGGKDFESTNTVTITFSDFVQLLEVVAQRVYPSSSANGANSMVALRRLMLENVLLMASRRAPKVRGVDVNQQDEAAMVVVRDTYAKTLMGIFKYYLDLADKRRSHEMATEAIKAGAGRASSQNEARCARQIREALSKQKDVIAYKEYTQFCHDFSLKSTALLTAIEVGEVFLNVVPYDHDTKALKGMTFAMFCDALVAMSVLAYRSSAVEHKNKVKALLHFMWRGVNRSDKKATALMTRDSKSSGQHAGSLNQFGSGAFCDFFIKQWIHEGFPNYTEVTKPALSSGSAVLKRIVESSFKHAEGKEGEEDAISGGGGRGDNEEKAEDTGSGDNISRDAEKHPRKRKILHGFMLAALFRTRPELAEMIHMEINNMHWSSAALD